MIIIIGKTASGKDTIVNKLVKEHNFKKCITYTTRPMRPNEKQDITYHFISDSDFRNKINNDFFAEWKSYKTEFGEWLYGTALNDLQKESNNTVIILTPDGYRDIKDKISKNHKSFYIYSDEDTIKERLILRGDNPNEAQRRIAHDNIDFKGIENEVYKVISNNKNTNINDIVNTIISEINI